MITYQAIKGMNTAGLLDERRDVMSIIGCAMEALTDDLIPAILSKDDKFTISYEIVNETITFAWNWKSREMHNSQSFHYSPCAEPAEAFIATVKAYFFDLCVMLANL